MSERKEKQRKREIKVWNLGIAHIIRWSFAIIDIVFVVRYFIGEYNRSEEEKNCLKRMDQRITIVVRTHTHACKGRRNIRDDQRDRHENCMNESRNGSEREGEKSEKDEKKWERKTKFKKMKSNTRWYFSFFFVFVSSFLSQWRWWQWRTLHHTLNRKSN